MQEPTVPPPPPGFKPVPPPPPGFAPVAQQDVDSGLSLSDLIKGKEPANAWQKRVKPVTFQDKNGNPVQSVQREDGAFWLDPSKGYNVAPGWYDQQGNRVGDAPGQQLRDNSIAGYAQRIAHPFQNVIQGGAQAVERGLFALTSPLMSEQTKQDYLKRRAASEQERQQEESQYQATKPQGYLAGAGELAGNFLVPSPGFGKGGGALSKYVLRPGAQGALMGALQPVNSNPSDIASGKDQYIAPKLMQMGVGGGSGIALNAVLNGGVKLANGLRGNMAPAPQQVINDASAQGIDLKPSAISKLSQPPPAEVLQAKDAVQRLSDKLSQDVERTPFSGLKDIQAAAATPGPRQGAARAILERIESGGQDAQDLVKTSAGLQALKAKMKADALFANRDALASQLGEVETPKTLSAIDDAIAKLKLNQYGEHSGEIAALEKFRARLSGPTKAGDHLELPNTGQAPVVIKGGNPSEPVSDIYGTEIKPGSNPVPVFGKGPAPSAAMPAGDRSYKALSATRSGLGDEIAKSYKGGNAVTGAPDAAILQPIKDALSDDLSSAAQKSGVPELAAADKAAREFYSKYKGTFKDPTVVQAIQSADPDKVVEALSRAGKYKAQRIFEALDPKGQAALAKSVFNEATSNAINPRTGDFIPGNVAAGINSKLDALGVTLKGENKIQLDGLQKVMQHLAKVEPEQASALGQRMVDAGSHVASGSLGAGAKFLDYLKSGGTDFLFNSPQGKKLLFASSELKVGSPAMGKLIEDFMKKAPGVAGMKAGSAVSGEPVKQEQP